MKCIFKFISVLIIINFSFIFCFAQGSEIKNAKFCQVIKNPSKYDGKTLRLKAILVENVTPRVDGGDSYLYEVSCRKENISVVLEWKESTTLNNSVKKKREELEKIPDNKGNVRSRITFIGKFNYSERPMYGHLGWANAQFTILRIEKVSGIALSTPWKKKK